MEPIDLRYPLLVSPGACFIGGPSHSGKSTIIAQILLNKDVMFNEPTPKEIVYCHMSEPDNIFYRIPDIHFHQGVPAETDIDTWISQYSKHPWILILDDMLTDFANSDIADKLLSRITHHHNCYLFLVGHTLFSKGKSSRLISLNCHSFILTRSCRDYSQLTTFGRQLLGTGQGKKFLEAYLDATEIRLDNRPSYLFVNVHPICSKRNYMLFTNIFPEEAPVILYKTR